MEEPFSDLKMKISVFEDIPPFVGGVDLDSIINLLKVP